MDSACRICPERGDAQLDKVARAGNASCENENAACALTTGARFCILFDDFTDASSRCETESGGGCLGSQSIWKPGGGDQGDFAEFRKVFITAVARAARVAPGRVRILDIRPTSSFAVDFGSEPLRERSGAAVPSQLEQADGVDTGAGVLAFLMKEDSPRRPLHPKEPTTASQGSSTKSDSDACMRIFAVIRELNASTGKSEGAGGKVGGPEEPSALEALDQVIAELEDSCSALQGELRPWASGTAVRLWCPGEANLCRARGLRPSARLARRHPRGKPLSGRAPIPGTSLGSRLLMHLPRP
jgi:hypothetical protein